jgi:gas vesicle protein
LLHEPDACTTSRRRAADGKESIMASYDDTPYLVIERKDGGVGAFLLGALMGAGVALLFAPRAGTETREELRVGVNRLRERAEETVRGLQDTVTDTIGNVRTELSDRMDTAREAFEAGRQAARDTRRDMELRVSEAKARVRAGAEGRQSAAETNVEESSSETGFGV